MRNTLGLSVLGDSLLATSDGTGSNSTSFKLRGAVLQSALVGHMGVTRLDGVKVLLLLVAGMRKSKSCQAQDDGFVEDHGICRYCTVRYYQVMTVEISILPQRAV